MATAKAVFLDTGPLVAFFNRRDQWHSWAVEAFSEVEAPMKTCDAVLSEVLFLTKNNPLVLDAIAGMIRDGVLSVEPVLSEDPLQVLFQVKKYADLPGSLADLSLVWMCQETGGYILTLDSDFHIYRDRGGKKPELRTPY
ncbi:MAG: PIN domain-containing protein [Balneolia bacterium]|nr:PIN domain-containing protein [Balneolia bacterium]